MRLLTLLVLTGLTCLGQAIPAAAQDTLPPPVAAESTDLPDIRPVQISLNAAIIERFIKSVPPLLTLQREFDKAQARNTSEAIDDDLSFILVPHLFDPKSEERINEQLAEFGFANYSDWADAAHSVALAAEAAVFGRATDFGSQQAAARRDIEADPKLQGEARQSALDELENQFAALAEFEPLPGNVDAVKPFLARLKAAQAN